jgi:hypothetical protein
MATYKKRIVVKRSRSEGENLSTIMATYAPVVYTIDNRITGKVKKFYLNELEALVKGEMELLQEDKDILANSFLTDLLLEGVKNMQEYNKGLADGSVKPFSKVIICREDV